MNQQRLTLYFVLLMEGTSVWGKKMHKLSRGRIKKFVAMVAYAVTMASFTVHVSCIKHGL